MRAGRIFATMLLFMMVGPPIGGLVFMLLVALAGMGKSTDLAGLAWVGLFALLYAVPFSYLIGFAPALAAGFLVGAKREATGQVGWKFAIFSGVAVAAGYFVAAGQTAALSNDYAWERLIMAPTCIVSTIVCWGVDRIVRR